MFWGLPAIISQDIEEADFWWSIGVIRAQQNLFVEGHKSKLLLVCRVEGFTIFI